MLYDDVTTTHEHATLHWTTSPPGPRTILTYLGTLHRTHWPRIVYCSVSWRDLHATQYVFVNIEGSSRLRYVVDLPHFYRDGSVCIGNVAKEAVARGLMTLPEAFWNSAFRVYPAEFKSWAARPERERFGSSLIVARTAEGGYSRMRTTRDSLTKIWGRRGLLAELSIGAQITRVEDLHAYSYPVTDEWLQRNRHHFAARARKPA